MQPKLEQSPTVWLALPEYLRGISDVELARCCHWSSPAQKFARQERARRRGQRPDAP